MIKKVQRDTLANQVIDGLLAFIDEQDLTPGDSLPSENQLAEEFGVSRPIIREALKTLQGEGLIEIITGKSATIRPVSSLLLRKFFTRAIAFKSATFRDLIEVRRGLEIQSVRLAASNCTEDDIKTQQQLLMDMKESLSDHKKYASLDVQFHLNIADMSGNPMLFYLIESIRDVIYDNILQGMKHRFTEETYQQVQTRHEAIVEAMSQQDSDLAQQAMEAHFDEALIALYGDKD